MESIITNSGGDNMKRALNYRANEADNIKIAVAFFSDDELLKKWEHKKKIDLIVSLRPPTSFYSLKAIQTSLNIETNFLGDDFHSKFVIFYKNSKPIGAVLGSSNFTSGGLVDNIETNIFINDSKALSKLHDHFCDLLQQSNVIQPSDLDEYEVVYKNYIARRRRENAEVNKFKNKIARSRTGNDKKIRISKKAKQYFIFWKIVDEIKGLIKDISEKEYPDIPVYLTLDHFWHYIKTKWHEDTGRKLTKHNQSMEIPKLFKKYIRWQRDTDEDKYLNWMNSTSKNTFQAFLSEKNIDKLTKVRAKKIFQCLHSSGMPIQRFDADEKFISENKIEKIRISLRYLLHSNDELGLRIHNLIWNEKYKLNRLGASGVQEITGWTRPTKYPIRNEKADDAIKLLGYNL